MSETSDKGVVFRPVISLGTLVLLLGMAGSLATIVWQGGALRTTLEDSISSEHNLRESQLLGIHEELSNIKGDVRELRTIIINTRGSEKK